MDFFAVKVVTGSDVKADTVGQGIDMVLEARISFLIVHIKEITKKT